MYSRIELKKTARNIKRVARQNDVSEEEVRRDMLVAMNAARSNDDPAVKARWETFHYGIVKFWVENRHLQQCWIVKC